MENANINSSNNTNDFYTIDVKHITKSLWKRVWFIVASTILAAIVGFLVYACVAPTYSSTVMFYVNNSSNSQNNPNFSINSSELPLRRAL